MSRSRKGLTTNIHTTADTQGRPLCIVLTGGEAHDRGRLIVESEEWN